MAGESTSSEIFELSQDTVRLIGSSQVITSAFSVVKELAENSVDAGATILDVKLDQFGLEKIEVLDNGKGVRQDDVLYVAKRHYTSKMKTTDDLLNLSTYGFRGEALGSLCALSDLKITTKSKEDDISFTYMFDKEGNITEKKPSHVGQGTCVAACNLFKNLPVRKQYYGSSKHKKEDLKKIEDFLMVLGVVVPSLRITLRHDKELVWQKLSMSDTKSALQHALGRQVVNQMLFLKKEIKESKIAVSAYIPKPGSDVKTMSRSSGDRMFIVVNSRPVHMKELAKILKQYYSTCHGCESLRHPVCYVSVDLPVETVDVNVDPNKTQVFLQHLVEVRTCLEEILLEVYGPLENVPSWHYSEAGKESKRKNLTASEKDEDSPQNSWMSEKSKDIKNGKHPEDDDVNLDSDDNPVKGEGINSVINLRGDASSLKQTILKVNNHRSDFSSEERKSTEPLKVNLNSLPVSNGQGQVPTSAESSISGGPSLDISDEDLVEILSENVAVPAQGSSPTLEPQEYEASSKIGEDNLMSAVNDENSAGVSWSRGTSLQDKNGNVVQPVQLLPPTSLHRPGKRPPSPTSGTASEAKAAKHARESSDMDGRRSDIMSERPESPFTHYCKETRLQMSQNHPDKDEAQITDSLKESWSSLSNDQKVKYRDLHWQQVKRYEKQAVMSKTEVPAKKKQTDGRETVCTLTSQSQAERPKKVLKKRLYFKEETVFWDLQKARPLVEQPQQNETECQSSRPVIIGQLGSHDLWYFIHCNQVQVVKADRLREHVHYQNLLENHKLEASPCDPPIPLNDSVGADLWPLLEKIALQSQTTYDDSFPLQDERIVANGFDIKCRIDDEGRLQAELVGLCDYISTYSPDDLNEVLRLIATSHSTVRQTRPLKVQYYLQGEAVRLAHWSSEKTSQADLQKSLCSLDNFSQTLKSFNHKPMFHSLVDLSELL